MKNYYRVRYVKIGELEKTLNQFSKEDYEIIKMEQFKDNWVVIGIRVSVPYEEHARIMRELE